MYVAPKLLTFLQVFAQKLLANEEKLQFAATVSRISKYRFSVRFRLISSSAIYNQHITSYIQVVGTNIALIY